MSNRHSTGPEASVSSITCNNKKYGDSHSLTCGLLSLYSRPRTSCCPEAPSFPPEALSEPSSPEVTLSKLPPLGCVAGNGAFLRLPTNRRWMVSAVCLPYLLQSIRGSSGMTIRPGKFIFSPDLKKHIAVNKRNLDLSQVD
jgi:hypothetical protein